MFHAVVTIILPTDLRSCRHLRGADPHPTCHARFRAGTLGPGPSAAETAVSEPGGGYTVVEPSARKPRQPPVNAWPPPLPHPEGFGVRTHRLRTVPDPDRSPSPHQIPLGHRPALPEMPVS